MKAICLRGLGFGDEGKGTIVDFLARKYSIRKVVRDNGGPQAAHNVVDPKNLWHCFAQFGSSMLLPDSQTLISRGMYVEPMAMLRENQTLTDKGINDAFSRIRIDSGCCIVTPLHRLIGRMAEAARGPSGYGSCGMGVGQAVQSRANGETSIILEDAFDGDLLENKLAELAKKKFAQAKKLLEENKGNREVLKIYNDYAKSFSLKQLFNIYMNFSLAHRMSITGISEQLRATADGWYIIEGAQGAWLDPIFGPAPYVTKTRTTMASAYELLNDSVANSGIKKIGVVRAYGTRHGDGPFVAEEPRLGSLGEKHNTTNRWQKKFRTGWFDMVATRYAIDMNGGMDSIALTNLDRLSSLNTIKICVAYEYQGDDTESLDRLFEWNEIGKSRFAISRMKPDARQTADLSLADILFHCNPLEYKLFPGWKRRISNAKIMSDLPNEAKRFVEYLQSADGMNVPVSIVSVGPRSDQKVVNYDPCFE